VQLPEEDEPQDAEIADNFNCLMMAGDFCTEGNLELTPFVQAMPRNPVAVPVKSLVPPPVSENHQLYDDYPPVDLYENHIFETTHQFHPDLPPSTVWGFNGNPMGETYVARYGEPYLIRFFNELPVEGDGGVEPFGKPEVTIHLHNAHTASESDGNPINFFPPGTTYDNHHTMFFAGDDPRESLGTLWYHDHRFDFTAQNTYKGLTGFTVYYDEFDSGDENDPNPDAAHYPSGDYDVPIQLADKAFGPAPNHELYLDIFNTDGFIGDQYTANMVIQPYFEVEPRKYRFRFLNVGPSRFYQLALSTKKPFHLIAADGNLLKKPLKMKDVRLTVAERMDMVVDFSKYDVGEMVYLLNLEDQVSGKGGTGIKLDHEDATKLIEFRIIESTGPDNSKIPKKTRDMPKIKKSEIVDEKTFVFDNQNGIWTINGEAFDENAVMATVTEGTAERWHLINTAIDWEHPVHIHMEEHHIVKRNGKKTFKHERGRKDVTVLGPGDSIEMVMRFRDFTGKYPIHCHNTVHEDHAMMARWDILPAEED